MAYLDIAPMLQAMRARPSEFEMQGAYLRHNPSHHLVDFDTWGNARVHARCDCAMLEVSREQSDELKVATAAWKVVHWEPHLARIEAEKRAARINREFASHFRPPNAWRRFLALFRRDRGGFDFIADAPPVEARAPGAGPGPAPAARTASSARRELLPG